MPFERGTLAAWGGHAGFFGLLLSLSVLVPSAVSAFVLCWIAFHISGRAGVPEVVTASIPWLLLYMDPDVPYLNLSSGFVAAQILLGIVCVPLAIVFAARLKRRGNAH